MNKKLYLIFLSLFIFLSTLAQNCIISGQYNSSQGISMSINLSELFLNSLFLNSETSYLVAMSSSNQLVGSKEVYGLTESSIVLWDETNSNGEVGVLIGDTIHFQLIQNDFVYSIVTTDEIVFVGNTNYTLNSAATLYVYCNVNSLQDEVYGCTDSMSINYDTLATFDNLSCIPNVSGCNDVLYLEYLEGIYTLDSTACITLITYGCMNPYACNFDETVIVSDGNCLFPDQNLDCNGLCLADSDLDGICDTDEIYGCTNEAYLDFDSLATENSICDTLITPGCMDSQFVEYNELATYSDGSCATVIISGCNDSNYIEFNPLINSSVIALCVNLIVEGCMNQYYLEYNVLVNVSNNSCVNPIVYGCMDDGYIEYNLEANIDFETSMCLAQIIEGCTDEMACNFNESANIDNGSCYTFDVELIYNDVQFSIAVETNAVNPSYSWFYSLENSVVMIEDQSISIIPGHNGLYEVFVTDNEGCVNSTTLPIFNVGIYDIVKNSILLYPNPAQNLLNINLETKSNLVEFQILNTLGACVFIKTYHNAKAINAVQLQVDDLPKGMYLLKVRSGNYTQTLPWFKQ